jgi:hypothetical protein
LRSRPAATFLKLRGRNLPAGYEGARADTHRRCCMHKQLVYHHSATRQPLRQGAEINNGTREASARISVA